jgi:hypothetical protein
LGIGQSLYQKRDTRKWGALTSYVTSSAASGIFPVIFQNYMLTNTNATLDVIASNFVSDMLIIGLILAVIGVVIIHNEVK